MKKYYCMILCLFPWLGFSQVYNLSSEDEKEYPVGMHVALISRFADPGIYISLEYPWLNNTYRTFRDGNDKKETQIQYLLVPNAAYFQKIPIKQNSLMAGFELCRRAKNQHGFFTETALGINILNTSGFYNGKELYGANIPEGFYITPVLSAGLGNDLFFATDGKYKYLWNIRIQVPVIYSKKLVSENPFLPLIMIKAGFTFYAPKKWTSKQQYRTYSRATWR